MHNNPRKHILILLIVSLFMLTVNLEVIPVNIMEARNFITAREMVEDNHWILTTLNGAPRYEKPPLPTWITAGIGMIFGFNSVSVLRLAVVFITLLLVFYIYKFSKKTGLSDRNSFNNGLILITSFYVYFAGRDNQWDMYCHSFMIVSIFYLWNIFKAKEKPYKNAIIGGIFFAFSIMSKGPISLYALLLPFLIAYGWVYKFTFYKEKKYLIAFLLYLLIGIITGTSWSVYIHLVDPEPLIQMAEIETSRWVNDYNSKSVFYYWSFFTQSGLWTVFALLALMYPYMKSRVSDKKIYRFTLLWTLVSLILLSIIPEKKVRYLLPVLLPLALNTGFYIEYIISGIKNGIDRTLAYFSFGVIGLVATLYPLILFFGFKDKISGQMEWAVISSLVLCITGIIIFIYLKKNKLTNAFYSLIVLQCLIVAFVFPLAKSFLYNPNYKPAKDLHKFTDKNTILYNLKHMTPEIVWDYGEKIPVLNEKEVMEKLEEQGKIGLLCQENEIKWINQNSEDFHIKKVSYVDLNTTAPKNKGYKDRLTRNLFIIWK